MNEFWVATGGAAGCLARYAIATQLQASADRYPYATLMANVASCILLGVLLGLHQRGELSRTAWLLLATGFCGGFSTFSTFCMEAVFFLEQAQTLRAFGYIALSILLCLAALFFGLKATRLILSLM